MSEKIDQPSQAEKHALVDAAAVMEEHGVEIRFPWECSLDDRERELYEALVMACRAYKSTLDKWPPDGLPYR